jgi:excisionase family DNA binding protein
MQYEMLTAEELAQKLKVSLPAVRRWTMDGMPCRRLGGRLVRFEFEKTLAWLERKNEENKK